MENTVYATQALVCYDTEIHIHMTFKKPLQHHFMVLFSYFYPEYILMKYLNEYVFKTLKIYIYWGK